MAGILWTGNERRRRPTEGGEAGQRQQCTRSVLRSQWGILDFGDLLGQAIVKLEPHYDIGPNGGGAIGSTLGGISQEANKLQLKSALNQIRRVEAYIFPERSGEAHDGISQAKLREMLIELHVRMCEDLDDRVFLSLDATSVPLYKQNGPFGLHPVSQTPS
jgi:hypothetical protein